MTRIFYHSSDLDGHMSGAIARYFYEYYEGKEYKMYPYNYGQPFPEETFLEDDELLFLDCSIQPQEEMIRVMKKYNTTIIDHHITTESLMPYSKKGSFKIGEAGCELTWKYFFPLTVVPYFVSLLGRYDVWDNSDIEKWNDKIVPFQYGMKLLNTDPCYDDNFYFLSEKIAKAIDDSETEEWIDEKIKENYYNYSNEWIYDVIFKGKTLLKYSKNMNKSACKYLCHEVEFEGLKALVANTFVKNSQFFESKYNPDIHDCMIAWTYNGTFDEYGVSLYTTKDIDLSVIAKKYSGGGHKQASGFGCKNIYFENNKMIVSK